MVIKANKMALSGYIIDKEILLSKNCSTDDP